MPPASSSSRITRSFFNDSRAALDEFNANPNRFDAIVSDLTMPNLTGLDMVIQLRSRRPGFPAVIIIGYGHDAALKNIGEHPHCCVVAKPFEGEELLRALRQVLRTAAAGAGTGQTPPAGS